MFINQDSFDNFDEEAVLKKRIDFTVFVQTMSTMPMSTMLHS